MAAAIAAQARSDRDSGGQYNASRTERPPKAPPAFPLWGCARPLPQLGAIAAAGRRGHGFLRVWPQRNTQRDGRSGSACGAWPERPGVMRGWVEYPGERQFPPPVQSNPNLVSLKAQSLTTDCAAGIPVRVTAIFFVHTAATSRPVAPGAANDGDDSGPSLSDLRLRSEGSLVHQPMERLLTLGKLM